jgi:hypothetical protein
MVGVSDAGHLGGARGALIEGRGASELRAAYFRTKPRGQINRPHGGDVLIWIWSRRRSAESAGGRACLEAHSWHFAGEGGTGGGESLGMVECASLMASKLPTRSIGIMANRPP